MNGLALFTLAQILPVPSRLPCASGTARGPSRNKSFSLWEKVAVRRLIVAACAVIVLGTAFARAEETPRDIKGLYLLTDYPAVTVRPGTTSTVSLRLQNYNLPPERLELTVSGVPSGWTATLLG